MSQHLPVRGHPASRVGLEVVCVAADEQLRGAGHPRVIRRGVPATEVARRAGHSVVLLKMYAHCIDGQADAANKHIADALLDSKWHDSPTEG
jgi:hypothetical protein